MVWLTWRQFRAQAAVAAGGLLILAVALAATGPHLAHLYASSGISTCPTQSACSKLTLTFLNQVKSNSLDRGLYFLGLAVMFIAPALIGIFWGAPLVSRELEEGTYRLAWNQGVTRTRWITAKLALLALASVAVTGLLSLMITWWAHPIDRVGGYPVGLNQLPAGQLSHFSPLVFATRGVTPLSYAACAFVLGVSVGVIVRRTLPAMAITLVVFAALQVLMPTVVRAHLMTPAQVTTAIEASLDKVQIGADGHLTAPADLPGAWIISTRTITTSGAVFVLPTTPACQSGTQEDCDRYLAIQHLRQVATYQPSDRYWDFQWRESTIFAALTLLIAGLCIWRVRTFRFS
jgi:hypothetical protein